MTSPSGPAQAGLSSDPALFSTMEKLARRLCPCFDRSCNDMVELVIAGLERLFGDILRTTFTLDMTG